MDKPYAELAEEEKMVIRYELMVIVEAMISLVVHVVRRDLKERLKTPVNALTILGTGAY